MVPLSNRNYSELSVRLIFKYKCVCYIENIKLLSPLLKMYCIKFYEWNALSNIRNLHKFWLSFYIKIKRQFKCKNKVSYNSALVQHMMHFYNPPLRSLRPDEFKGRLGYIVIPFHMDNQLTTLNFWIAFITKFKLSWSGY